MILKSKYGATYNDENIYGIEARIIYQDKGSKLFAKPSEWFLWRKFKNIKSCLQSFLDHKKYPTKFSHKNMEGHEYLSWWEYRPIHVNYNSETYPYKY